MKVIAALMPFCLLASFAMAACPSSLEDYISIMSEFIGMEIVSGKAEAPWGDEVIISFAIDSEGKPAAMIVTSLEGEPLQVMHYHGKKLTVVWENKKVIELARRKGI